MSEENEPNAKFLDILENGQESDHLLLFELMRVEQERINRETASERETE